MVAELVASGQVRISDHGYDELVADRILVKDLVEGISRDSKGRDESSRPRHGLPSRSGEVDRGFHGETKMTTRRQTKLVHEGQFVAQVEVDLIETDSGWSPCLSLEDAYKLDDVREALRRGDIKSASRRAQVFVLTPVAP